MTAVEPFVLHETDRVVEGGSGRDFGALTWRTLISGDRMRTDSLTAGVAELPPGELDHVGLHRHAQPEIYYVLAGDGILTIDGIDYALRAGSTAFIPGDSWHAARNTGASTLRIFYVFAADSFSDVVYEFAPIDE